MTVFRNKEILLGVTGGIAAYKAAEICSRLVQGDARVSVVMTRAAHQFIGPTTFEALTGRPVYCDPFDAHEHYRGEHIGLAERADIILIAPATASLIAHLALGLASELLSTTVLAASVPVFVAPAMNCEMWAKPAVQRNVRQIQDDGMIVIDPEEGWLSCGRVGAGRMAQPDVILARISEYLSTSA